MKYILAVAAIALVPGLAHAQPGQTQFAPSVIGAEVRGAHGTVLGEVAAVERNERGDVVAAEIPGLEPADAPRSAPMLVADRSTDRRTIIGRSREGAAVFAPTRTAASGANNSRSR